MLGCSANSDVALNDADYQYINSILNSKQIWENKDNLDYTSCGITQIDGKIYFCTFYKYSDGVNGTIGGNGGEITSDIGNTYYWELTDNGLTEPTDKLSSSNQRALFAVSYYQKYDCSNINEEKQEQIK